MAKNRGGPRWPNPFDLAMQSLRARVPMIDLAEYYPAAEVLALVPEADCRRLTVIPVATAGSSLIVALEDPFATEAIAEIRALAGMNVEPVIASGDAIARALDRFYRLAN